jgi:peptidoglycan hydrolase-like protein with peptidoglycan-binding domain
MKRLTRIWVIVFLFVILLSSAAQAAALGSRTLSTGMSGEDVGELQQLLKRIGYFNAGVTGYYGNVTKQSVVNFQSAYGLTRDGIAGSNTIYRLKYENGVASQAFVYTRLLKQGMQGADVQNLQEALKRLGFLPAGFSTTQNFGSQTYAGVTAFQKAAGLTSDGMVGTVTAAAINSRLTQSGSGGQNTASSQNGSGQIYTVQPGDTLWGVSKKYNVSITQLQQANGLSGSEIRPGQKLSIPSASAQPVDRGDVDRGTAPTVVYTNYTVKAGDNLWSIANTHSIPQNELMKANNFNESTVLSIGQVIKIPSHNIPVKQTPGPQYGELLDWWTEAQYVLSFNAAFTVTDFATGTSFKAMRTFGANHADCEPLTAQDTAAIRSLWDKYHTSYWTARPVIISINGRRLAASMTAAFHAGLDSAPNGAYVNNRSGDYGYGQNFDAIKGNGADGHFDIHFLNSTTHKDGTVNSAHQANVKIAAGVQ